MTTPGPPPPPPSVPPPPPGAPIPPPGATPFMPPPGYAAYSATNWRGDLSRVGGLAKAILILLGVYAVGQVIGLFTSRAVQDAAEDFLAGGRTEAAEDEFNSDVLAANLPGTLIGLVGIAIIVLSIIWLRRMIGNHQRLGRLVTWTPGWAIAGWILPPLLFIIPLLVLRETWKASAPDVPPNSPEWKQQPDSPLPWVWFLVYSIGPIALGIAGAAQAWSFINQDTEDLAEYFADNQTLNLIGGLVALLGTATWFLLVRAYTRRHGELTGEAAAR